MAEGPKISAETSATNEYQLQCKWSAININRPLILDLEEINVGNGRQSP